MHTVVVQALLEYGAKVRAKDKNGNTALHRASLFGREDVVRLSLENKADPMEKNNNGQTPKELSGYPDMLP